MSLLILFSGASGTGNTVTFAGTSSGVGAFTAIAVDRVQLSVRILPDGLLSPGDTLLPDGGAVGKGQLTASLTNAVTPVFTARGVGQLAATLSTSSVFVATSSGTSAFSGVEQTQFGLAISPVGQGLFTAVPSASLQLTATSRGVGTLTLAASVGLSLSGTSSGTGTFTSSPAVAVRLVLTFPGVGQLLANMGVSFFAVSLGTGTFTSTALLVAKSLVSTSSGIAIFTAGLTNNQKASGTSLGVGTYTAGINNQVFLSGTATGVGQMVANTANQFILNATATGVANWFIHREAIGFLGIVRATSFFQADLVDQITLDGISSGVTNFVAYIESPNIFLGVGTMTGGLGRLGRGFAGVATGVADFECSLGVNFGMKATTKGTGRFTGVPFNAVALQSLSSGLGELDAFETVTQSLVATSAGLGAYTGAMVDIQPLIGVVSATSAFQGTLMASQFLVALSSGTSNLNALSKLLYSCLATTSGTGGLVAQESNFSFLVATPRGVGLLQVSTSTNATLSMLTSGQGAFTGTTAQMLLGLYISPVGQGTFVAGPRLAFLLMANTAGSSQFLVNQSTLFNLNVLYQGVGRFPSILTGISLFSSATSSGLGTYTAIPLLAQYFNALSLGLGSFQANQRVFYSLSTLAHGQGTLAITYLQLFTHMTATTRGVGTLTVTGPRTPIQFRHRIIADNEANELVASP